jgi:hypothetical protein
MTWIRVRDGFVNSDHIVRIVEDIRDGIDTASILHLVDGSKAIADIDAYDLIEQLQAASVSRLPSQMTMMTRYRSRRARRLSVRACARETVQRPTPIDASAAPGRPSQRQPRALEGALSGARLQLDLGRRGLRIRGDRQNKNGLGARRCAEAIQSIPISNCQTE